MRGALGEQEDASRPMLSGADLSIFDPPRPILSGVDFGGFDNDREVPMVAALALSASIKTASFVHELQIKPEKSYLVALRDSTRASFQYDFHNLLPDALSGLTAGIMMLPQGLAYASLAQLPAIYGLFPGFIPALVYAAIGPCKQSSVGPEAMRSELVGVFLANIAEVDRVTLACVLSFLSGLIMLVMGMMRLGFIESLLSHAVVQGFILSVATTIIIEQIPLMMGFHCPRCTGSGIKKMVEMAKMLPETNPSAVAVSVLSVGFLITCFMVKKRLKNRFPWTVYCSEILALVLLSTFLTYGLSLHTKHGVEILDIVHTKFVIGVPQLTLRRCMDTLPVAIIISLVSYIESFVVLRIYSKKHKYRASANSELIALGTANIVGAFFGSYGCQGSLPRSQVQDATGAKTNLSLTFSALFVGLAILVLLPGFKYLPKPTMGAIVLLAACRLMDFSMPRFFIKVRRWQDLALWLLVAVVTVGVGIEEGILVGGGCSLLILVKTTSIPSLRVLGQMVEVDPVTGAYRELPGYGDTLSMPTTSVPGVLLLRIEGQIFFANASRLEGMLQRADVMEQLKATETNKPQGVHSYVIDLTSVQSIDASGLHTLEEIIQEKHSEGAGVRVVLVARGPVLRVDLERAGVLHHSNTDVFDNLADAVASCRQTSSPEGLVLDAPPPSASIRIVPFMSMQTKREFSVQ